MNRRIQKITGMIIIPLLTGQVAHCTSGSEDGRLQARVETTALHSHTTNAFSLRLLRSGIRVFDLDETLGHRHAVVLTDEESALLELGVPVYVRSERAGDHDHGVFLQVLSE